MKISPQLKQQIVNGDWEAWQTLWKEYAERKAEFAIVKYFCITEDIHDRKQEISFKLYQGMSGFDCSNDLGPWVIKATINHCINKIRVISRRPTYVDAFGFDGDNEARSKDFTDCLSNTYGLKRGSNGAYLETVSNSHLVQEQNTCTLNGTDARDKIHTKQCKEVLQKALKQLPQRQQSVVELRLEGYSYKEIAAQLSVPLGTVMSDVHVAKEKLNGFIKRTAPELLITN